ncbi:MAG: response regulator [Lachnospiraceae bacterium]
MKTAEIITNVCTQLGVAKADLAKRMGLHPSSLYRKLSKESMTFEELQKCLDVLGVSMELEFRYPDGDVLSSQANYEQMLDRMDLLEKELEVSNKAAEFEKKLLRHLRTELYSAVGYAELGGKHGSQTEEYLKKLQLVLTNMEKTIAYGLGESFDDETYEADADELEALKGKRILLVDDNELNREILRKMLEDYGLLIEEAEDGMKAIASVKGNDPGYFHFILMDVEMPEMDGYEATLTIRNLPNRIRANIPIIALTANAVPENRERASVVGMDDFLVKPANSARLLRSLVKLL